MSDMTGALAVLHEMDRVAKAAEERAAEFRRLTDSLKIALDGGGNRPPDEIASLMTTAGWANQVLEALDSVQHVHSGSSEAMYGRSLRTQILRHMESE